MVNIWTILVRQGKWKTLPLLLFYTMALVAIAARTIVILFYWTLNPWITLLNNIQPVAKICVGLTQAWMIFELCVRIHKSFVTNNRNSSHL